MFKELTIAIIVLGLLPAVLPADETLLIDDFERGEFKNRLEGDANRWEMDPNNPSEWTEVDFVEDEREGKSTRVLKLDYRVTENAYNGYYSRLQELDAQSYQGLRFYIKGGDSYPDRFKLSLKNTEGESGGFYLTDIDRNWQKVEIPFRNFRGTDNFRNLEELLIMFEGSVIGESEGTLYFDKFEFYADSRHYRTITEKKAQKEETLREEVEKVLDYSDEELLDYISRTTFNYFWDNAHPETGFIRDRSRPNTPSSIAATGFGLAAICIADERGWIETEEARQRVLKTLKSMRDRAEGHQGYFYHFIYMESGRRAWNSELSSIDTALFLGGAITAGEYYGGEIKEVAEEIYKNVNWPFMMDSETKTIYMGWDPEDGFKPYPRWDTYSEHLILYLLGLGSPTYPLPEESWHAMERPVKEYEGLQYIYCAGESLFVYHFSHAFFDFREKHDDYSDYWTNSLKATKANRLFAKNQAHRFRTYEECFWGLSAGDGPDGYRAFGATHFTHNGTVAPYSAGASMPFIPEKSKDTLRRMISEYGHKIWDQDYGFVSTFNLDRDWFATDQIGIDLGIMLLMIENYRSGLIWETFMESPYAQKAMGRANFRPGSKEKPSQELLEKEVFEYDTKNYRAPKIDSASDLAEEDFVEIDAETSLEYGEIDSPEDLSVEFALGYNDRWLFLVVNVTDDIIVTNKPANLLYEDDSVELFISPEGILRWGDREHFQIGFAPSGPEGEPLKYAFFQNEDPGEDIRVESEIKDGGYKISAAVSWDYLDITPEPGKNIGMSVAVHDRDYEYEDRGAKINWFFEEGPIGIMLGELILE